MVNETCIRRVRPGTRHLAIMCQSCNEYIELICQTMPTNHRWSMPLRINGKYYAID